MKQKIRFLVSTLLLIVAGVAARAEKPNILIIYLDDMGWGQPSCYGGKLAPTPHIDSLARDGVRFTAGYVSACVCSPSRVGLMTGRYQARTGHDNLTSVRAGTEMLLSETTMAQRLKALGYATGLIGKWHLGDGEKYLPPSRGFDYFFGTIANLDEGYAHEFYRGLTPIPRPGGTMITAPLFATEALQFVDAHRDGPFFLYLALHGVHSPYVASPRWVDAFAHIENKRQQLYAALLAETDEAVGRVLDGLHSRGLDEQTLVFCISDNGGVLPEADQGGLRGQKWLLWEGGIRVPFFIRWTGKIPGGRVIHEPVIQLDVLPTAIAAAGASVAPDWRLDGVNLLPLLTGAATEIPRSLYWRYGPQYAIRRGDWKLVSAGDDMNPVLIDLARDRGEKNDLSAERPQVVQELKALWDSWNATLIPPRWDDPRNRGDVAKRNFLESLKAKQKKAKKAEPK